MANVLIIGSGGREHSIACKLAESTHVSKVIVSPGNGGTECTNAGNLTNNKQKISNSKEVPLEDYELLARWCKKNSINLVVVGPEVPLANGIANVLSQNDVLCFGPSSEAAALEASKSFSKDFMVKYEIPTARYQSFTNAAAACDHINSSDYPALVVKASGLAAGKGVIVCKTKHEACDAAHEILEKDKFGKSGEILIVEELLYGEEFSVLCFTDGKNISVMPPIQDHKRIYEGDAGPNTGGMGAYGPCPQISQESLQFIKEKVLRKAIDGMRQEDKKFVGVLYAGVMMTKDGAKVLEFNCRFGDPECQVLLSLLKSDLYLIMKQCIEGELNPDSIAWNDNISSICVVMSSEGYPGSYKKGRVITGIDEANQVPGVKVYEAGTALQSNGSKVTSGGRVLSVCAISTDLQKAADLALHSIKYIKFQGSFYRKDIGWRGLEDLRDRSGVNYASAGVNIQNGNDLIKKISPFASNTSRKGCNVELGGFGGIFDLGAAGYSNPVLVSGTDGVGTKLLLAQESGNHSTIGQDLVAMCVNDILTHNAEPLFFLDYFACGKLKSKVASRVIEGIANGCKIAGCALIGGETAEMPGMYSDDHYDLAGFAVGAYDKDIHVPLPRLDEIHAGDVVIGVSSSGLHSNGFSLVRSVLKKFNIKLNDPSPFELNKKLVDSLLTPTAIYSNSLLPVFRSTPEIKAVAHITGGGIVENLARVLPGEMGAVLDAKCWNVNPVLGWLAKTGNISSSEMLRTFNCGIGLCLIVKSGSEQLVLDKCISALTASDLTASIIGKIEPCNESCDRVMVGNFGSVLTSSWTPEFEHVTNGIIPDLLSSDTPNVAVFISGTGTNLQALIDHSKKEKSSYKIALVISNKSDAGGLKKASVAGIPHIVLDHKSYPNREKFDRAVHDILIKKNIQLVCLAGFMRLLSSWFTCIWQGRILNIHPSLLPAFKGMNAHKQVLEAGVRISGCTVHFVTEDLDAGAIIAQTPVEVKITDDVATLSDRVKDAEHAAYPHALDLVACGKVSFDADKNCVKWQ